MTEAPFIKKEINIVLKFSDILSIKTEQIKERQEGLSLSKMDCNMCLYVKAAFGLQLSMIR